MPIQLKLVFVKNLLSCVYHGGNDGVVTMLVVALDCSPWISKAANEKNVDKNFTTKQVSHHWMLPMRLNVQTKKMTVRITTKNFQ
jgi:hypothetical protein